MSSRQSFFTSTVGSKLLVAVTGLAMFGFLILHLIGNLMVYLGPDTFNHYGHKLISNPLVYPAEAGLVAVFVLHIWKTIRLTLISRSARPESLCGQKVCRTHDAQEPRLDDDGRERALPSGLRAVSRRHLQVRRLLRVGG